MTQSESDIILRCFFNRIVGVTIFPEYSNFTEKLYELYRKKEKYFLKMFFKTKVEKFEIILEKKIIILTNKASKEAFIELLCLSALMVEFYPTMLNAVNYRILKYILSKEFENWMKSLNLNNWNDYINFLSR